MKIKNINSSNAIHLHGELLVRVEFLTEHYNFTFDGFRLVIWALVMSNGSCMSCP